MVEAIEYPRTIAELSAETIVLLTPRVTSEPTGRLWEINQASGGLITKLVTDNVWTGAAGKVLELHFVPGLQASSLILVGLGEPSKITAASAFQAAAAGAKAAAARKRTCVAFAADNLPVSLHLQAIVGSLCGGVGQDLYRAEKAFYLAEKMLWLDMPPKYIDEAEKTADSINWTRRLVNLPPNHLYPERFVELAHDFLKDTPVQIDVWDETKLRQQNCNALLAVAQGSIKPPRLMIVNYAPEGASGSAVAIAGKGVTFDSGGLSLKPTESMTTMKCDMAGAATAIGIIKLAAELKLKQSITVVVGLVENLISGNNFKLGDVITSRQGKTIEILNTDAEGRVVLADVLDVIMDRKPTAIVDLATLTGACVVALGTDITGVMGNDQQMIDQLRLSAEKAGEYIWPLPMYGFFNEQVTSKIADIKNVGDGRWGGAITAAKFLENFIGNTPWCHLDIAGPAFLDKPKPWMDAGGTGCMIRTLIDWLKGPAASIDGGVG
jgi:leucyl aminopeptidase